MNLEKTNLVGASSQDMLTHIFACHDEIVRARARNASLSNSLRSLTAQLETADSDERERAREEGRAAHTHVNSIREARAILDDNTDCDDEPGRRDGLSPHS